MRHVNAMSRAGSVIHVRGGLNHEVRDCTVNSGQSGALVADAAASRGVWLDSTRFGMVYDNALSECAKAAVEVDAGCESCVVFSNQAELNGLGILVGETAQYNFVYGNSARANKGDGIRVFSQSDGPTYSNVIAGNTVQGNAGVGISAGGAGGDSTYSSKNYFCNNLASGNTNGSYQIALGGADAVSRDYWVSSKAGASRSVDDVVWAGVDPTTYTSASVFEPDSNATADTVIHVHRGYRLNADGSRGAWVGNTTSALQSLIDTEFESKSWSDYSSASFFDAGQLRYLDLSGGAYTADVTLYLPSMSVLRMDKFDSVTGLHLVANPTKASKSYPAVVYMDTVKYTAVLGGFIDASKVGQGWAPRTV